MLLHFIKHLCLLIRSSSIQIKLHLLTLMSVVASIEVSPATSSSTTTYSSSFVSASSPSGVFLFLFFPIYSNIYWEKLYFTCYLFLSFCCIYFFLLVTLISSFLSHQFRELLWLFFCLCRDINCMVLIGRFKAPTTFKYQQQKLSCLRIDY